jgi:hypothetical protein
MKRILFCAYHKRDLDFYIKLLVEINLDFEFHILYFIDESFSKKKINEKIQVINFFKYIYLYKIKENNLTIKDTKKKFLHEQIISFKNFNHVKKKYNDLFFKITAIIQENNYKAIFHEIGGFVVHHVLFDVCSKLRVDHFFFEPSPKMKYTFLIKNSWAIKDAIQIKSSNQALKLFKEYKNDVSIKKIILLNEKDNHIGTKGFYYYIFSIKNFFSFLRKLKFFLMRKKTILNSFFFHIKFLLERFKNRLLNVTVRYANPDNIKNGILIALQYKYDFAMSYRSYENFDQKKIILNKIKLNNFNIYFKEHPSFEGSFNFSELNISKKINFLKSHLSISNLLNKIDLLITFNSKAGLEALLKKKPVICLSDSIYSGSGLAFKANKKIIDDNIINKIIKKGVSPKKVKKLFISIFKKVFFFNLFTQNSKDISLSSLSFRDVLKKII